MTAVLIKGGNMGPEPHRVVQVKAEAWRCPRTPAERPRQTPPGHTLSMDFSLQDDEMIDLCPLLCWPQDANPGTHSATVMGTPG